MWTLLTFFFNLLERTLSLLRQELRKLLCIAFAKNEKRKKKEWVAFYSTRKRRMNSCIFRNFQWKKSSNLKDSELIRLYFCLFDCLFVCSFIWVLKMSWVFLFSVPFQSSLEECFLLNEEEAIKLVHFPQFPGKKEQHF